MIGKHTGTPAGKFSAALFRWIRALGKQILSFLRDLHVAVILTRQLTFRRLLEDCVLVLPMILERQGFILLWISFPLLRTY